MARSHLARVANVILSLDADIVHLSEIEGCDALDALVDAVEDAGGVRGAYRPYMVPGTDTATGQNVGLLTKLDPLLPLTRTTNRALYPIPSSTCDYSDPTEPKFTYGVSKHHLARFPLTPTQSLILAGAHLLAFPDKRDRCEKREAQAAVLAGAVRALREEAPRDEVLVLGDLNDFDEGVVDAAGEVDRPISLILALVGSELVNADLHVTMRTRTWSGIARHHFGLPVAILRDVAIYGVDIGAVTLGLDPGSSR
ncbi:hypothetical protein BDK51DRAFT_49680 [Blyttiomyces helicus]|uniref:Endonuclease/exonuclease/phosphatase n=1 Tax=Blyttiomyces helicus TaxID=388810 RepID=A0A4P9W148_9FUNG|nr:hypothetical protein BDK51DRAFT_49680 [Blyttiomyces helicus]|eukprot:RKO83786.1 hypothetical protein BDK51DRAFT_49680 [Blyttiomyces helicus]